MMPIDLREMTTDHRGLPRHVTPKVIDHAGFHSWFIFGESNGAADIANVDGDLFQHVPTETARKIIQLRDEFLDKLQTLLEEGRVALHRKD